MSSWHGGKGSKQRPTDKSKFNDNWDKIFAKPCPQCGMKGNHKMDCTQPWIDKSKKLEET
jgi:hypothetical protein